MSIKEVHLCCLVANYTVYIVSLLLKKRGYQIFLWILFLHTVFAENIAASHNNAYDYYYIKIKSLSINGVVFPEHPVLMSGIFHEVYSHQFPIENSTNFMLGGNT